MVPFAHVNKKNTNTNFHIVSNIKHIYIITVPCTFCCILSNVLKVALNLVGNLACYKQKTCKPYYYFFSRYFYISMNDRAIFTQHKLTQMLYNIYMVICWWYKSFRAFYFTLWSQTFLSSICLKFCFCWNPEICEYKYFL